MTITCNVCGDSHTLDDLIPVNDFGKDKGSRDILGCPKIQLGQQALVHFVECEDHVPAIA